MSGRARGAHRSVAPAAIAAACTASTDDLRGLVAGRARASAADGGLAPLAGGYAADRLGLQAPLWGLLLFAVAGSIAALGLRETAPRLCLK